MNDLIPDLTRAEWIETLIAAAGVLVGIVVAMILTFGIVRVVHRITRSSESQLDDRVADSLRGPFVVLVGAWIVATGTATLSYASDQQEWVRRVAVAVSVLAVAIGVRRVIVEILNWQATRPDAVNGKLHPGSLPLIRRGLTILVYATAFLIMLDTFGIAISPLLAGLGIGGLAVALALQPLLANVFASSYMLSDSSIRIGDWVEITGGPTGYVDDIGWRATRIRSFDNNVVIVPNSTLADSVVTNYSLTSLEADTRVELGVAYEEDLARVEAVCLDVLFTLRDEWETALKEHEPICRFTNFGDSNIGILLKMRAVTWADSFLLKHELTKRIHARFTAEGITINYPARRLFMQQGDIEGLAALDALRARERPQP